MNWQFYDFWGNFFLQVARGHKQMEDMAAWVQQGFSGMNDMAALFRRSYGLQATNTKNDQNYSDWRRAINDFQKGLSHVAGQWGWVSRAEYRESLKKCKTLEKKMQEQQETIAQLRELLTQKGMGHAELFRHLQSSLKEQNNQFHVLMEGISGSFKDKS